MNLRKALICLTFVTSRGMACQFELHPRAPVASGDVFLSQLGTLSCKNPHTEKSLQEKLEKILIARIFPGSPDLKLQKTRIEDRFLQQERSNRLEFSGPEEILLHLISENITHQSIKDILETQILEAVQKETPLKVEWLQFPDHLVIEPDKEKLELDTSRAHAGFARLKTIVEGRIVRQHFIRFALLQESIVLIATERLERGEQLNPRRFRIDVRWLPLNTHPVDAGILGEPGGLMMARTVLEDEILTQRDVIRPPLVRQRQILKAILKRGSLKLEIEVKALQDGRRGDRIQVLSPETQRQYTARVLDETTVEIIL